MTWGGIERVFLVCADDFVPCNGRGVLRLGIGTMLFGISETLRQYLVEAIPGTAVKIAAITDLAGKASAKTLMLVLYKMEDAGDLRTAPARMAPDAQEPVALRLQYLITDHGLGADESQQRLSQVLDAFHEHPVFTGLELHATLANRVGRLTIQLRS